MDDFVFKIRYRFDHQPPQLVQSLVDAHIEEAAQDLKELLPAEIERLRGEGAREAANRLAAFNAFLGEWFVED
jgi:hypothetical protein